MAIPIQMLKQFLNITEEQARLLIKQLKQHKLKLENIIKEHHNLHPQDLKKVKREINKTNQRIETLSRYILEM